MKICKCGLLCPRLRRRRTEEEEEEAAAAAFSEEEEEEEEEEGKGKRKATGVRGRRSPEEKE